MRTHLELDDDTPRPPMGDALMGCPEELAARKLLSAEKRLNREKSVLDGSRNGRQGRDPGRMLKSDKLSTMTWVELRHRR